MEHILSSRSGDGWVNLATDEYLLERYRRGEMDGVTLYFYVNSNAVIIGRNQNAWRECDARAMEEDGVQLVRRHTGGGAVYHDGGNLNFSFITDERHYDKERFNRVILAALKKAGVEAEVSGRNDFTANGRKFSGCAYGLMGPARAMHGTLLVSTDMTRLSRYLVPSKRKLAAKGISSVRARVVNLSELAPVTVEDMRRCVTEAFTEEFGECEELIIPDDGIKEIERLTQRNRSWEWRMGRTPAFDHRIEGRFSFGELELLLKLRNGRVAEAEVFTDALDTGLAERIAALVKGKRFDTAELCAALAAGGPEGKELAEHIITEENGKMTREEMVSIAAEARRELHGLAERSLGETRTKAYLMRFLAERTSLRIVDKGAWFYAVHDEGAKSSTAVRADFDAVPVGGGAEHRCGHDGHSAALLLLALMLEGRTVGRNVVLLFQHAEEIGAGAKECCALFSDERVDEIVGLHNIPGEPMGTVLLKRGCFACASCGAEIRMTGSPTHAAYPENGVNPTAALCRLALKLPELAEETERKHSRMTLTTVVGMDIGARAFGVAASDGRLMATLRSESTAALDELVSRIEIEAAGEAEANGLSAETKLCDVFPATENDPALVESMERACIAANLPYKYLDAPFRWSEDFGEYGAYAPALFFGLGSGEDTAPLHTEGYEYPDELLPRAADAFMCFITRENAE
ncbi:MAG: lipoate--protein ligase [Clostridia bacterium]|nr:lipoate--protein ligase [Clostridia bacterium]